MINKIKILSWTGLVVLNLLVTILVIGAQALYYALAPVAVIPNHFYKDDTEKRAICMDATTGFNKILIPELLIAAIILFVLNYFWFKGMKKNPGRRALLFFSIFIIITGLFLTYFSMDYISKNMSR
jgi:hypothetical protein